MKSFKKIYDISIIGNGITGLISAFLLSKKFPQKKILVIGKKDYENSASMAAGAMHAVFCEIEKNFSNSKMEKIFLRIGLKSRKSWLNLIKNNNLQKIITAKDTIFYLKPNAANFEKQNFDIACKIAKKYKKLKRVNSNLLKKYFKGTLKSKKFKCYRVENEFSFNPIMLKNELLKYLYRKIDIKFKNINKINFKKNKFIIDDKFLSKKLVVCSGFGSADITKNLFNAVPVLKGVGTAFILKNNVFKNFKTVIRTSNRGGAQCGLHILPYNLKKGEIYVGAGNYISNKKEPHIRLETINYLLRLLREEFFSKKILYNSKIKILKGYRPKSLDNCPSIGAVNKNLYYVSGTNRVGLSWSPYIAEQIVKWIENKKTDPIFSNFKPDRKLKTWGNAEKSYQYYASSRVSNLYEHKISIKNEKILYEKLFQFAKDTNIKIVKKKKLGKNFVIDPDCYKFF